MDGGWSYEHLNTAEPGQSAKYQYIGFNYKCESDEHIMSHQEMTMMLALSKYCVAARMSRSRF